MQDANATLGKSIDMIHSVHRVKVETHSVISRDEEQAFDKI